MFRWSKWHLVMFIEIFNFPFYREDVGAPSLLSYQSNKRCKSSFKVDILWDGSRYSQYMKLHLVLTLIFLDGNHMFLVNSMCNRLYFKSISASEKYRVRILSWKFMTLNIIFLRVLYRFSSENGDDESTYNVSEISENM